MCQPPLLCPASHNFQVTCMSSYREYPPYLPVSPCTRPQGSVRHLCALAAQGICVRVGHRESLGWELWAHLAGAELGEEQVPGQEDTQPSGLVSRAFAHMHLW